MKKLLTLCVVHKDGQVLLGMKKRGFGAGKWNGFGGKLQEGESIEAAAKREVLEEAGIKVTNFEKVGLLTFEFLGNPEMLEVHVFRASEFSGDPVEGEEMRPQWFTVSNIPYAEMWPDDKYWIPLLLAGSKFKGIFVFGEGDKIISQELEEVAKL